MQEFEVIEDVEVNGKEKKCVAISYPEPEYIKFNSKLKLKRGDRVNVDGNSAKFMGNVAGEILERKSAGNVSVSTDFDIKYTGGYSLDGSTIYLDEHFPPIMKIAGKDIDARKTIGLHHELPEKWLSDDGYEYPYAHEMATGIEKKYVESLGITWKEYCSEVDKNLRHVYSRMLEKSPPSLDLAPYLYCRDKEALNEIRKSRD